jgi:hypothetical protein
MYVAILLYQEWILFEIRHIIERRQRLELEHQPAHVGIKETFADAIRIVIVVHMLMMAAMFAGPKKNGILKRGSAEDDRKEPHDPVSPES